MPTNRRSGTNRQPSARRPKVAGLRKRPTSPASTETAKPEGSDQVNGTAVTEGSAAGPEAPVEGEATAAAAAEPEAAADDAAETDASPEAEAPSAESARTEGPEDPGTESSSEAAGTESVEPAAKASDATATESAAEPESETAESSEPSSEEQSSESGPAGKPWVLWGATALLFALAVFFGVATYTTYNTGSAANEALTSAGATSEVNGQVSDGVEKLFSYDFNDTAKTENAAKDLLVGEAVQKYNELFSVVKQQAPQQQLIVTTTVKNSAVTHLNGDRAEVLVFVDQHAMRANTGESNIGPAQISVSAEKQGDKWKITQLTLR
ncbi:hypothetical protein EIL87_25330 [Saccharopolyspora rhizosphaerae]|uniref:Mce-associated membrane protein n=1 Tax=Saccharopolyspora rhizosphaerae TaxID=2492662 RepID=A0A3R8PVP8_9PSEU|nr:hypothetical protein [Saccharopolyspora rhizosphaerae]RRO12989.1 hypothetical protein EIL87_25330 [Saccharopolyspora rhizosphaerae]